MAMSRAVHVCSFATTDHLGKNPTYVAVRADVLKAGRFSAFEATDSDKRARIFTDLSLDPTLVLDHERVGYPWTLVRLRRDDDPPWQAPPWKVREQAEMTRLSRARAPRSARGEK